MTKEGNVNFWSDIDLGDLKNNTVLRIAFLMKDRYGVKEGVEIKLTKKIPVCAGLGGGSSNAATAIRVLSQLWNLDLKDKEMQELASEIGSDVNFFLIGGTAIGEGRGEIVKSIDPLDFKMLLLVKPQFGVKSGEAYQSVQEFGDNEAWKSLLREKDPSFCFNRFERVLFKKYPELEEIVDYMQSNGALKAMVTGSGSTVIGFYNDQKVFDDHFDYYRENGFWCCQTKTKRRLQ